MIYSIACLNTADIICESSLFSTLCTAITQAGLRESLSGGTWTLFSPTNDAFAKLGDTLNDVLADNALLTDILLNHAVEDVVFSNSLECGGSVLMANGEETTTICESDAIFQSVNGNEAGMSLPQIVLSDVHACNGVMHLLSEVLVPNLNETGNMPVAAPVKAPVAAPVSECRSIGTQSAENSIMLLFVLCLIASICYYSDTVEIACSTDSFSTLCAALTQAGLDDTLSEGAWTVFAPTNMAFSNLGATLDTVLADMDLLTDILLYHVAEGVIYSTDLTCNGDIVMANGKSTLTICENNDVYIAGEGSTPDALPMVVLVDIPACEAVIHAVDEVILPML